MSKLLFTPHELIIDTDYATLVCYPAQKIVHHSFHRPVAGQEFRSVLEVGIGALQKYGATKWLSDDRGNSALCAEDLAWSNNDWFPRAANNGWKSWALVVPPDIKARMSLVDAVGNVYEGGVRVMVFTDLDEAKEWLVRL